MGKLDKLRQALEVVGAAKPLLPGAAGTILDMVTAGLDKHASPASPASAEALKQMAAVNDKQNEAILALLDHVQKQDERIAALEAK